MLEVSIVCCVRATSKVVIVSRDDIVVGRSSIQAQAVLVATCVATSHAETLRSDLC